MITFVLHFLLALLNVVGAVAAYSIWSRKDFRRVVMGHLFLFFTFFIGYHLSLSLPFWFFSQNLIALAWGYNVAIVFLFLLLAPMYSIMVFQIIGVPMKKIGFCIWMLLLLGLVTSLIQIYDFRLPIIDSSGFIIWNNNPVAGAISFLAGAMIAVSWLIIFLKNKPADLKTTDKIKAYMYTVGGMMFSLASIYFIARNILTVVLAFIFVFIGTVLMNSLVLIPEKKED
jgi:hypothetical protein